MSAMTRSMPYMSSSGNPRPQSMMMMSLPYSRTVIFLPISLSPPRGMIFNFSAKLYIPLFKNSWFCRSGFRLLCGPRKYRAKMPAQETPVPSRASGLSDAEAKRTHKFQRTASASPTPSRRISPWLSAKAVLLVPLRPPHRPGQTASSASGCLHPQMQSVCAALRLLKKMGTLFMLHGSIAQHLQKVYKFFRYFLSIP